MPPLLKIPCFIIDDNPIDREATLLKVMDIPFLEVKGEFSNALEALELLNTEEPGILLLDLNMPGFSGLELVRTLDRPNLAPVIITSYPEYAAESYEYRIVDYLVKPLMGGRFHSAIVRAREYLELRSKAMQYDLDFTENSVIIKDGYDSVRLRLADIIYLEALKDYTRVVTNTKTYITSINLKESLGKLPHSAFLRIHRSFAVAKRLIRSIEQGELLLDCYRLPIGKTFRRDVSHYLKTGV